MFYFDAERGWALFLITEFRKRAEKYTAKKKRMMEICRQSEKVMIKLLIKRQSN